MNLFSRYKINIMNAIFAFIMFFCCLGYVNADLVATIHSTTTGGNWNSASTWQEGRVPTANDVVEINGLVEIPGNITTGSVKINTSGTIRKKFDWGTNNYTLSISGSLENNGVLGGTNNQYHIPFVVNVSGNVLNNGTMNFFNSMSVSGDLRNNNAINNISGINAYGKLLNGPNSNVTGNISIQGSTKEKDLVIETQPNFTPTIYMNGDMTLKTDLDFRGNIYLQNKNLYVDGTKNIYLNIVYGGGKVLSMNGNGDGENLKVSQIHGNAETNIENLEILTHMYGVKGRNIVSKGGYLLNTSTFDKLTLNGYTEIVNTTTLNGNVLVTGSGTLRRIYNTDRVYYTLTVSGSLENNGLVGGINNYYNKFLNVNITGDVLNNGTINYFNSMSVSGDLRNNNAINNISGINAYGKLLNGPNSNVTGNISIQGSTKEKDLVIETQPNFTPTIYMNGDMTLKTDLDFRGSIYLQNKNLYVDGTKNIYLNILVGGGKVLSMNGNGDGENLKVSQIHGNAETNIENLEILTHMYGAKGRKINAKGYVGNVSTFDKLTLNGYTEIVNTTTLNGNVLVTGSGTLRRIYNTDRVYYTLTVSGSLENNGLVGGIDNYYHKFLNVNITGDILNNGTMNYFNSMSVKGSIDNINGNIDVNTYLTWTPISGYSSYLVNITGQNEVGVNTTSYLLPASIKETGLNQYWKVKGDGLIYDSAYTQAKCINVAGCVKINYGSNSSSSLNYININYPYLNNNNIITSGNVSSGPKVFDYASISVNYTKTETKTKISEDASIGDPVILSTGEFDYDNTLMSYAGNGIPFEFKVRYKNSAYYVGPLGNNFDFNYNIYLSQDANGNINLHDGKLGVFKFTKTANGFEKNQTIRATLTNIGGNYKIKYDDNKTYNFGTNYKISSIQDNYSNTISFEYNTNSQLTKITDTLGRVYSLSYNGSSRLSSITDFNANKVEFVYYLADGADGSQYDLQTIKMLNGNSDKQIGFTYTVGTDYESSHNLLKLIDSENNTYVENTYDTNDRVLSQKYGSGTINYNYTVDTNNSVTKNSVTDREGNIIDYFYDTNGNTTKKVVKKSSGDLEYNYIYDSNNNLLKEIKPLGNGIEYSYDTNRNITETRFKSDMSASGSTDDIVQSITYDLAFNKPTQIVSPNGLTTNFTYDINGNVVSKQVIGVKDYQDNNLIINETYEYDGSGQLLKQINASGLETSFVYGSGNLLKITKGTGTDKIENSFEYNSKGNMVKAIDGKGNITTMSYNDFNLLTQKLSQEGIVSQSTYNKLNKKLTDKIILGSNGEVNASYEYDILDNLTKTTQEIDETKSIETNNIYDTNSRIIETNILNGAKVNYIYDENGLVLQKKVTYGVGANDNLITNYQYDSNERLIKEIVPNVSEISYQYDLYDRIIKKTRADNSYETYTYDKQNNITTKNVYSSNNELLSKEEYEYDKLNQLLTTKKDIITNQTIESQIISHAVYNNVGKVTKTIDGKGNETNYSYDAFSRLIETTDNQGNKVKQSYDKNNNVIQKQIISSNNKTVTTSYTYDGDNRLTSETNSENKTKTYTYNNLNQIISKTDEKGNITNYEYNYSGKVTKETKVTTTGNIITNYTYDNQGNLTKVIDGNGNITNYEYDKLNRLTKQIYPDNKETNYTYDNRGNLTTKTDANGTIVTNTYDNQNRVTNKIITPGAGVLGTTNESYTYDELGRMLTANDSNNHELMFNYDSLNRLTSETQSGAIVNYTYDNNNNITNITNPDNKTTNYTYDTLNRVTTIKQNNETIINNNFAGLENTSTNYGNNKTITKTYDNLMRISSLNNGLNTYSYTYDDVNNITSDNHKNYSYDDIYRITQTNDTNTTLQLENFAYDNVGNRLTSYNQATGSGANYSYTKNNLNQYTNLSGAILSYQLQEIVTEVTGSGNTGSGTETGSGTTETGSGTTESGSGTTETGSGTTESGSGTTTGTGETTNTGTTTVITYTGSYVTTNENIDYIYDNNGNLKQDNKYKYYYDYKNRLVKATNLLDENIVEFAYDVLNRRFLLRQGFEGQVPKITKTYIYSNENILQETTTDIVTNTTKTRDYINGLGVDEVLAFEENANRYYYHTNHLGSIVGITDNSGNTVVEYDYDTFGKAKVISGDANFDNTRLYTGREYDKELGLYYNRARYYNPELARFISRDPIDIADDVNLYAYVGNNGVNFVDRSGTIKKWLDDFGINMVSFNLLQTSLYGGALSQILPNQIDILGQKIGTGFEQSDLSISSYMLGAFMYRHDGNYKFGNGHFISKKLKNTDFYNNIVNEIKSKVNDNIKDLNNGKIISIGKDEDTVTDSNSIREFDFGNSFGRIKWSMTAKKLNDGSIETNLNIKDEYKFFDKDGNGDPITNPFNIAALDLQNKGLATPFSWELNITDKLDIN